MAENKTKATEASVESFLNSLSDERRADAKALVKMMQSVAGEKPKVWARRSSASAAITTVTRADAKGTCP